MQILQNLLALQWLINNSTTHHNTNFECTSLVRVEVMEWNRMELGALHRDTQGCPEMPPGEDSLVESESTFPDFEG